MRACSTPIIIAIASLLCCGFASAQTPPVAQPTQGGSLLSTLAPDDQPEQNDPIKEFEKAKSKCPNPQGNGGQSPLKQLRLRKYAPTVGTGGAVGGPTGLLTIYDGKTMPEGDYTYSLAYSNFDRDPGNVDITEIPNSYNLGLPYRMEFFFNTDVYRGIKVNNPRVLSSFYLPNSQLFFGPNLLGSGPAIVLAPFNNRGLTGALFRPAFNQPFVRFPFIGQRTGDFGIQGAPAFVGVMGAQPVGGRFGAAGNFPGIGSIFGSILPGVVLATQTNNGVVTPTTFSLAPTYLPDAPFINRLYGESSFSTVTLGLKIRFSTRNKPYSFGLVPFYRFYTDHANDSVGFNQLQRGSSPGGNLGDFGLVGFISQKLNKNVTLSGNFGYVLNSNPTSSTFGSQRVTLLDRPNELPYGIAADFSFEKADKWQPIVELRGTKYVGGRTPNALENNPVDLLIGTRFFLSEQHGITVAYRLHLNQQGNGGGLAGPLPPGGIASSNPHGFMVQLWAGHRKPRKEAEVTMRATANPGEKLITELVLPCANANETSASGSCPSPNPFNARVPLEAKITDTNGKPLDLEILRWEQTGGHIIGTGKNVTWDLSGVAPEKTYVATVVFRDEDGIEVRGVFCLPVKTCPDCRPIPTPTQTPTIFCPTSVTVVAAPIPVTEGTQATFTANVAGLPASVSLSYNWTLSPPARIINGDGTQTITVDTTGLGGKTITATVQLGGLDPSCKTSAQGDLTVARAELPVDIRPVCKLFDSYGAISYNDEKARLDNFVIALNENPQLDGFIIAYNGGTLGRNIGNRKISVRGGVVSAQYRIDRAITYIKDSRGYTKQLQAINGGDRQESSVELYVCPANAPKPTPQAPPDVERSQPPPVKKRSPATHHKLRAKKRPHTQGS